MITKRKLINILFLIMISLLSIKGVHSLETKLLQNVEDQTQTQVDSAPVTPADPALADPAPGVAAPADPAPADPAPADPAPADPAPADPAPADPADSAPADDEVPKAQIPAVDGANSAILPKKIDEIDNTKILTNPEKTGTTDETAQNPDASTGPLPPRKTLVATNASTNTEIAPGVPTTNESTESDKTAENTDNQEDSPSEEPASSDEVTCFLNTVEVFTNRLSERLDFYADLLGTNDDSIESHRKAAEALATAEGYVIANSLTDEDLTDLKLSLNDEIYLSDLQSVSSIADLKFDDYFNSMFEINENSKEMPQARRNKVILYLKFAREYFRFSNAYTDASQCAPVNSISLSAINLIDKDPLNENKIELACNAKEGETFKPPGDEEGYCVSFWGKVDNSVAPKIKANIFDLTNESDSNNPSTGEPLLQGFNVNNKIIDVSYFQDKDVSRMIVKVVISGQSFLYEIDVKSNDEVFQLICVEPKEKNYEIRFIFKFVCNQTRKETLTTAAIVDIENLQINLMRGSKPELGTIKGPYHYTNTKYTQEIEERILLDTITNVFDKGNIDTLCPPQPKDPEEEKCIFKKKNLECEKCIAGTYLQEDGTCTEVCPDGTFEVYDQVPESIPNNLEYMKNALSRGRCLKCPPNCTTCKDLNTCLTCNEDFTLVVGANGASCNSTCPKGTVRSEDGTLCDKCTEEKCEKCENKDKCVKCQLPLYLSPEGKCVPDCPERTVDEESPCKKCNKCTQGCLKCKSKTECTECNAEKYLLNGVCEESCPQGTYPEEGQCKTCSIGCKTCENGDSCTECKESYLMDQSTKVCKNKCNDGQVQYQGTCINCSDKNCNNCLNTNVDVCEMCSENTVLKDGKCVDGCGDGNYVDVSKNVCVKCTDNCKTCTSDNCLTCNDSTFLLNNDKCVTTCPDNYISSGSVCIKCSNLACKECVENNLEVCTKCPLGQMLKEGNCVDDCGTGNYPSGSECKKCSENCEVCNNGLECSKCAFNFLQKGSICVEKCDQGMTAINGVCERCTVENCSTCPPTDKTKCDECIAPKVLYANICQTTCPVGTIQKSDSTCENCSKDCLSCNSSTTCTNCSSPKVLENGECKETCSQGSISINGVCTECQNTHCKSCDSDLKTCTECESDKVHLSGDCVEKCPEKMIDINQKCESCQNPCETCKDRKDNCLTCIKGFAMTPEGICDDSCPNGTVMNEDTKTCDKCTDIGCLKCQSDDTTYCIKCEENMKLLRGDCFEKCPIGYHSDSSNNCLPCVNSCKECSTDNTCEKCFEPNLLKPDGKCTEKCENGFIAVDDKCVQCETNCVECLASKLDQCTKCQAEMVLLSGDCINQCPDKFFEQDKLCLPCQTKDCIQCSSAGQVCEKCSVNYVLLNGECVERPCPAGTMEVNSRCEKCEVLQCEVCPNLKSCEKCKSPNFLINDLTCSPTCDAGTYPNKSTNKCENCVDFCVNCNNPETCKTCEAGYLLEEGLCKTLCSNGYYRDGTVCVKCTLENCDKCTQDQCIQCTPPQKLLNGKCVDDCGISYFTILNDNKSAECKECDVHCNNCEDFNTCNQCESGFVMSTDNKCIDKCPDGSVKIEEKCVNCKTEESCLKCQPSDLTTCERCAEGKKLYNGKCVDTCPEGNFAENSTCKECIKDCKVCDDDKSCVDCKDTLVNNYGSCVENCSAGTYETPDHKCKSCASSNCNICDAANCIKCNNGFLLENGDCVTVCSKGNFMKLGDTCESCSDKCVNCISKDTCTQCQDGLVVLDGKCEDKCREGTVEKDGKCINCDLNCNSCSSQNTHSCQSCIEPFVLEGELCVEKCSPGHYPANGKCQQCNENCNICDSKDLCINCAPGFVYQAEKNECVEKCQSNFRANIETGKCEACTDEKCLICNNNKDSCQSCSKDNFLLEDKCVPECSAKFYISENNECKKCYDECAVCSSKDNCKSCEPGFVLDDSKCVSKCSEGEVEVNGVCEKCQVENCKQCNPGDSQSCSQCEKVMFTNPKTGVVECKETCPEGTYENEDKKCYPCSSNCQSCGATGCNTCDTGFLLESENCVEKCKLGSIERNGKCAECSDKKCEICNPLNESECTKCSSPYSLKGTECVEKCPQFEWMKQQITDDISECKRCIDKCQICNNQESCLSCEEGSYLKDGKCVTECGDNYVTRSNPNECVKCTYPECKQCDPNNTNVCLECTKPYYLTPNDICVEVCLEGFYAKQNPSKACVPCSVEDCVTCSPQTVCEKCESPKVLLNNKCLLTCPSGYYMENGKCEECTEKSCALCLASSPDQCIECAEPTQFLVGKKCAEKCGDNQYASNGQCQECSASCSKCNNADSCTACKEPFVLNIDKCVDSCNDGHVKVVDKCEKCTDKSCKTCDPAALDTCTECSKGTYLSEGKCVEACPDGTYLGGDQCLKCSENCEKCEESQNCSKCSVDMVEENGFCVPKCSSGSVAIDGSCEKCNSDNCVECSTDLKTCTLCQPPLRLSKGSCLETCDIGEFYDFTLKECKSCIDNCTQCSDSKTCEKCASSSVLSLSGKCVDSCEDKQFVDIKSNSCNLCSNQNCKKCEQANSNSCIECSDDRVQLTLSNGNQDCVLTCPKGTYLNEAEKRCEVCNSKCEACTSLDTCTSCNEPFNLQDGKCVNKCNDNYAARERVCIKCADENCLHCDSNNVQSCERCTNNKITFNDLCIDTCPERYNYADSLKTCVPCPKNCKSCKNGECNQCEDNFSFLENTKECLTCDKPNVVQDDTCLICKVDGCNQCSDSNTCEVCDSKLIKHQGECINECPEGWYYNSKENNCSKCEENCSKCKGPVDCIECKGTTVKLNGQCEEKCPDGFSEIDRSCQPCVPKDCLKCENSIKTCTDCKEPSILNGGKCIDTCPDGTFLKSNRCEVCSDNCSECNDQGCQKCKEDMKIKNDKCVPVCGDNYTEKEVNGVQYCQRCNDVNCDKCSDVNKCVKCSESYFLTKSNECSNICPEGTYADNESQKCVTCDQGCIKCTKDKCLACEENFFMLESKCVSTCPEGMVHNQGVCETCVEQTCQKCQAENPEKCDECKANLFLFQEHCFEKCPRSTYAKDNKCIECDAKCLDCNEEGCYKCKDQFALEGTQCTNTCPKGKVNSAGECITCAGKHCDACTTDATKCLECSEPYKLYNYDCVDPCPSEYYEDKTEKKCKKCDTGCANCDNSDSCEKCKEGYFLQAGHCVTICIDDTKAFYGDCKNGMCMSCHPACDKCVGPTSKDCRKCANGYFNDHDTCVVPLDCTEGTFPNKLNQNCDTCVVEYCEECSDSTTCVKCVRGMQLEKGKCIKGQSFKNIFSSPALISLSSYEKTSTLFSDLDNIGVRSKDVSVAFFTRLLVPVQENSKSVIFSIKNIPGYDFTFSVTDKNRCEFQAIFKNKVVGLVDGGECSFELNYDWKYFAVAISKNPDDSFELYVNSVNGDKKLVTHHSTLANGINTSNIILNKARFVFGNDIENGSSIAVELSHMNVYDYNISDEEIVRNSKFVPGSCDFFCKKCSNTCEQCRNGKLDKFGYCPANPTTMFKIDKLIDNSPVVYNVKKGVKEDFTSDRWAISMWFFIESRKQDSITLFSADYKFPNGNLNNFKFVVNKDNLTIRGETVSYQIQEKVWYYVLVGVTRKQITVSIKNNIDGLISTSEINLKTNIQRLFNDYDITLGDSNWFGSTIYPTIYINNVPAVSNDDVSSFEWPIDCKTFKLDGLCEVCVDGYSKNASGECVDDSLGRANMLRTRVDLWGNEMYVDPLPYKLTNNFSISLFLRKKTHSLVTENTTYPILSLVTSDKNSKEIPIVTETLKPNYQSDYSVTFGDKSAKLSVDLGNVVYDYIHVVIVIKKDLVKVWMKDFQTGNVVDQVLEYANTLNIAELQLGDDLNKNINLEISNLEFYDITMNNSQIENISKIRTPKDCNSGCRGDCDLSNGFCNKCFNPSSKGKDCEIGLIGFTTSYIVGGSYKDYEPYSNNYHHSLEYQGFSVGVNSVKYSLYANMRLFSLDTLKGDNKHRLLSIGNYASPWGNDIIVLDVVNVSGLPQFVWHIIADSESLDINVRGIVIKPMLNYYIHAGIDVEKKSFSYIIYDPKNENVVTDTAVIGKFPEKLQEISSISLFGIGDVLPENFATPFASAQNTYYSINTGFNKESFEIYQKKYPTTPDPECEEGCNLCTYNDKNINVCLDCKKGYIKNSTKCHKKPVDTNQYVTVIDFPTKIVSVDLSSTLNLDDADDQSVVFWFRTYSLPLTPYKFNMISGAIDAYLIFTNADTATLQIASINVSLPVRDLYDWIEVVIQKTGNSLSLNIYDKEDRINPIASGKGEYYYWFDIKGYINFPHYNFEFYGLQISNSKIDHFLGAVPNFDCSSNCLMCYHNECASCTYGSDLENKCIAPRIRLDEDGPSYWASTKLTSFLIMEKYVQPIRSNKYIIEFVVSNLSKAGSIMRIYNPDLNFEISYDSANEKFIVMFNNFLTGITPMEIPFKLNQMTNSDLYMAFLFFEKTVTYVIFNSELQPFDTVGSFDIGNMDWLNSHTLFDFKTEFTHDVHITIDIPSNETLAIERLITFAKEHVYLKQEICLAGNRNACTQCPSGYALQNNGTCVIQKNVGSLRHVLENQIYAISRMNNSDNSFKFLLNNKKTLTGFTMAFWWRLDGAVTTNQGVANLQIAVGSTHMDLLNIIFTPRNELILAIYWEKFNEQVTINEFYDQSQTFSWKFITVTFSSEKKRLDYSIYSSHSFEEDRRYLNIIQDLKPLTLLNDSAVYATFGFSDARFNVPDACSFSISSIQFLPNAVSSSNEIVRPATPVDCNICAGECFNGYCKSTEIVKNLFNIGNILQGSDLTSISDINKDAENLYLFRPLIDDSRFTNVQTFNNKMIILEFNVNSYLSSRYIINRDVLLIITNDVDEQIDKLRMHDFIANDIVMNAMISITYVDGYLKLNWGSLPWNSEIDDYYIPTGGKDIKEYKNIKIVIMNNEVYDEVYVFADDMVFNSNLDTQLPDQRMSMKSMVYTHPALNKVSLNLHDPRIDDVGAQQFSKMTEYESLDHRFCHSAFPNCGQCLITQSSLQVYCFNCANKFELFNDQCVPDTRSTK